MSARLGLISAALISVASWAAPPPPPPLILYPLSGTTAPSNTRVWIFSFDGSSLALSSTSEVPEVTERNFSFLTGAVQVLEPKSPLAAGTWSVTTARLNTPHTFKVSADVDTEPPASPVPTVVPSGAIGPSGISSVEVTAPHGLGEFLVLTSEFDRWPTSAPLAMSDTAIVRAFRFAPGDVRLKLYLVDLAGNASEGVLISTRIPAPRSCSVAPVVPWSVLALALLRRRRSRG